MKKILIAATAVAFLAGTGAAMANDEGTADQHMNKPATVHHKQVKRSHSTTDGIGPENNAAAQGSLLPGKDRLGSRAYIKDKE
jgi:Ni/Co efflux regulator RcnB